jgi:hypothetical protein
MVRHRRSPIFQPSTLAREWPSSRLSSLEPTKITVKSTQPGASPSFGWRSAPLWTVILVRHMIAPIRMTARSEHSPAGSTLGDLVSWARRWCTSRVSSSLGGSIGSPVMSAAQGRHPRLRLSRSRQPHQGRLRRPPGRLRRALTRPPLPRDLRLRGRRAGPGAQ